MRKRTHADEYRLRTEIMNSPSALWPRRRDRTKSRSEGGRGPEVVGPEEVTT